MATHTLAPTAHSGGIIAAMDPSLTISGSYRKHLPAILAARQAFLDADVDVLRPRSERVISSDDGFVRLEDDLDDARAAAIAQRQAIRQSHMLFVVNPGGYVGASAIAEVGFASGLGIPVAFSEQPFETAARLDAQMIGSAEAVAGYLQFRFLRPADRSLLSDLVREPELVLARGPREGAELSLTAEAEGLALRADSTGPVMALLSDSGLDVRSPAGSRLARMLASLALSPITPLENR